MNTKIAAADAKAMNTLLASELNKNGVKTASENIEAFEDHADYISTLESVLAEDVKGAWEPNDPKLD